jgi:hypothetical protein
MQNGSHAELANRGLALYVLLRASGKAVLMQGQA